MDALEGRLLDLMLVFVLVLSRVGALVATAPIFTATIIPKRVKAILAVSLAMLMTPLLVDGSWARPPEVITLGRLIVGEALVGMLLGLGLSAMMSGVQVTGQVVGQMSGMALAETVDPAFQSNASIFNQVFYFVTMAVFVCIGGHRMTIDALLDTFAWAPPGQAQLGAEFGTAMVAMLSLSFELGLRAAAPLLVSLFLATLVLGLISRTLPQINTIAVGFGLNSMLTVGVMMLTIGSVAWTFQDPLGDTIAYLRDTAVGAGP
ncbi:flagellar biosynthesis protein FliR [Pseudobythopirellula maris]|uniref:Flagellar biosynthesis protein FliR n=1 Tax=Pseudobythopirellula maris TaxID=2527991 RepID=A0A5C5ZHC8_9BACT|nr:flagellar biosynthetic protein FliR [Pseudobythopirellula maris]TWT86505.1 flagellar biosynthesis protein FliR [Pseudobythopirellula maris]